MGRAGASAAGGAGGARGSAMGGVGASAMGGAGAFPTICGIGAKKGVPGILACGASSKG